MIRAGLDPRIMTPHVMRHTAITKLVQSGVDLPTIQSISGHKTIAMVLRYRTSTAPISTRRLRLSVVAYQNRERTKPLAQLHRHYTLHQTR